uniref:Amino acid transporter transmembrane domain-containing protein n=1 Tax=Populus davidiana TaxID=266767 RepID=A0A6M2FA13_9ROSI
MSLADAYFVKNIINKRSLLALSLFEYCFFWQNAAEKPPFFLPSWTAMYVINTFVVVWVLVVGFGFGGWASVTNFVRQVDTFGLFAKCYQCKPAVAAPPRPH